MRIGMMADLYKPHVSGVTTHIALTKRVLEAAGHEVFVFTFGGEDYTDEERNVFRSPGVPVPDTGYSLGLGHTFEARRQIARMDLLHAHHPFVSGRLALRYARPLGIPVAFTNHTRYDLYAQYYIPVVPEPFAQVFLQAYFPSFCRQCALVIAPSEGMRRLLAEMGVSSKVEIIPNGIEIEPFRSALPSDLRSRLGLQEGDVLGIYVGRLGPEKNIALLLRAFRGAVSAWPNLHLVLAGGGPERGNLEDEAGQERLRSHVHFLGEVPYAALPSDLRAADFFASASVSEVHPLTIIESMAAGLPAVGIDSPGVADIIAHERNGLLADNDLASLTAMLTRLAGDAALRARLSEGARRTAEAYSLNHAVAMLLEAYERAVREMTPRRPNAFSRWLGSMRSRG